MPKPRLRTLWMWHAARKSEHRSTAFDVYQALSGHHAWRIRLFRYVTLTFLWDLTRQTLINLWHDGSLWRWSTWRSGWRLLWARDGMLRASFGPGATTSRGTSTPASTTPPPPAPG